MPKSSMMSNLSVKVGVDSFTRVFNEIIDMGQR